MKFPAATLRTIAFLLTVAAFTIAYASDKKNPAKPQNIDAGTFGVFVKGNRVASETFTIHQQNDGSVIKSELKELVGSDPVTQKSDLEITSAGALLRYDWSQSSGGSLSVFPDNDFLKERITVSAGSKAAEQAFLMPATSSILDNNFFIHREVLVWRYLSAACTAEKCQKDPAEFGVLVPQDRTSVHARIELVGREKVTIRGQERELLRLNLKVEDSEWALWVDDKDQFKLIKASIPADNTEVVRD